MSTPIQTNTEKLIAIKTLANGLAEQESAGVLQEKTVTPGTSDQVISADGGYDGLETVTVKGDGNLLPENIKDGVSIFDVTGTLSGMEINTLNLNSFLNYRTVIRYYSMTQGAWVDVDKTTMYFNDNIEDADLSKGLDICLYIDYYTKYEVSMRISNKVLQLMQNGTLPDAGGI